LPLPSAAAAAAAGASGGSAALQVAPAACMLLPEAARLRNTLTRPADD
jgi:hypothetical protein